MIHIIEDLIEKGHAYVADDGVYFHVDSAPEKYGQLTGQSIDAVRQGLVVVSRKLGVESAITKISHFGNRQNQTNQLGHHLGEKDDQAGILNAVQ